MPVSLVIVGDTEGLTAALSDGPGAAVLVEAPPTPMPANVIALASFDPFAPGHAGGCACCGGRSPAAAALDRLFQAESAAPPVVRARCRARGNPGGARCGGCGVARRRGDGGPFPRGLSPYSTIAECASC